MFLLASGIKDKLHYIKDTIAAVVTVFICIIMLTIPEAPTSGIADGLKFCAGVLIPSLFPFMAISCFIVLSGISEQIGNIFSPVVKLLFYLPGSAGPTILLSLIGGYPAGAKGIQRLLLKGLINQEQAFRMALFAVGAGPAFIISVVGRQLFHSSFIGLIIFFSQISICLIQGIFLGIHARISGVPFYAPYSNNKLKNHAGSALVDSCIESAQSMINMCSFVIIFSALLSIANQTGLSRATAKFVSLLGIPNSISAALISILLEVNRGCLDIASFGGSPELASFAIGWAGICVHLQIFSALKGVHFSKTKFTLFRLLQAALSSVVTFFSLNMLNISVETFYTEKIHPQVGISSSVFGSSALLLTCIYFLLALIPEEDKYENKT